MPKGTFLFCVDTIAARMFGGVLMRFVFQRDKKSDFHDDAGGMSTMNSLPP